MQILWQACFYPYSSSWSPSASTINSVPIKALTFIPLLNECPQIYVALPTSLIMYVLSCPVKVPPHDICSSIFPAFQIGTAVFIRLQLAPVWNCFLEHTCDVPSQNPRFLLDRCYVGTTLNVQTIDWTSTPSFGHPLCLSPTSVIFLCWIFSL